MNEIKLKGRITRDSNDTEKGQLFTVAYNESFTDKNGNKQQQASFIPVAYRGEKLELKKGDAVQVVGELKTYLKDKSKPFELSFIVNAKEVQVLEVNKKQEQKSEVEQATEGKVSQGVKEEKVENKVKEQPKEKVVKTTKKKGMEI